MGAHMGLRRLVRKRLALKPTWLEFRHLVGGVKGIADQRCHFVGARPSVVMLTHAALSITVQDHDRFTRDDAPEEISIKASR